MSSNAVAHRPLRAIGFISIQLLALSSLWPARAEAQASEAPGTAMFACSTIQRPRLTELGQAAAAARKSSNLVTGVRVRQLEAQLVGVNAALVGVQNADDCQKVAAQIDTLRERLGRLAPGSVTASATGAATMPAAGAAPPAANAEAEAAAVCATSNDPAACRELLQPATQTPAAGYAPPPAVAPQPAYAPPQPAYAPPPQPAQAQPTPPSQDNAYLECQVNNRRNFAALEKEIYALRASGRVPPAMAAQQDRELAQWRAALNVSLLPVQCAQMSLAIAQQRALVQMAAQSPLPAAAGAPQPQPVGPAGARMAAPTAAPTAVAPTATAVPAPAGAQPAAPQPAAQVHQAQAAAAARIDCQQISQELAGLEADYRALQTNGRVTPAVASQQNAQVAQWRKAAMAPMTQNECWQLNSTVAMTRREAQRQAHAALPAAAAPAPAPAPAPAVAMAPQPAPAQRAAATAQPPAPAPAPVAPPPPARAAAPVAVAHPAPPPAAKPPPPAKADACQKDKDKGKKGCPHA